MSGSNLEKGILSKIPIKEKSRLLGEVTLLMLQSKLYSTYFVGSFYHCILPAIDLNQFRIYYKGAGYPIGFVCWAFLDDEKEKLYLEGDYSIQIDDWKCGNNLVFTEFIVPFGDIKEVMKDLTHNIFPDRIGKSKKVTQRGKIDSVKTFYGKNVRRKRD